MMSDSDATAHCAVGRMCMCGLGTWLGARPSSVTESLIFSTVLPDFRDLQLTALWSLPCAENRDTREKRRT